MVRPQFGQGWACRHCGLLNGTTTSRDNNMAYLSVQYSNGWMKFKRMFETGESRNRGIFVPGGFLSPVLGLDCDQALYRYGGGHLAWPNTQ